MPGAALPTAQPTAAEPPAEPPATDRLWLNSPAPATALARVVAVRGEAFALDRSPFAPTSHACRHPQPHDAGTVWVQGNKRNLKRVFDRDGGLWHVLDAGAAAVPAVGTTVQCQVDQDRRTLTSRAHTALHLLLTALAQADAPPLAADPEVRGGGRVRFVFATTRPAPSPHALAAMLAQVQEWVAADRPVRTSYASRAQAERTLTRQRFHPPDPWPGPDPMRVVTIDGVCAYPCDGTHVARTSRVGRVVVAEAKRTRQAFLIAAKVI